MEPNSSARDRTLLLPSSNMPTVPELPASELKAGLCNPCNPFPHNPQPPPFSRFPSTFAPMTTLGSTACPEVGFTYPSSRNSEISSLLSDEGEFTRYGSNSSDETSMRCRVTPGAREEEEEECLLSSRAPASRSMSVLNSFLTSSLNRACHTLTGGWSDEVSLRLQNSGSVARDHLALERTFLAYMRTSIAVASAGVGGYPRINCRLHSIE
jgi:hypothetical protein